MSKTIFISLFLISTQSFGQISNYVKSTFAPIDSFIYTYPNIELPKTINLTKSKLDSFTLRKTELYINYFLSDNKEGLKQALNRWKTHQNNLPKSILKKEPYTVISLVSSANKHSLTTNNSVGIYQLSFPIAAKYGLKMTAFVDERKGEKIDKTIINYIADLEKINITTFDILLSFFNTQAAVNRAKTRTNSSLLSIYYSELPESTRDLLFVNYALTLIIDKVDFGNIINNSKRKIERVSIPKNINLLAFEKVTKNSIIEVKELNPTLITNTLPNGIWRFPIEWNIKYELDTIYFYQDSIMNNPNYGKVKDSSTIELIETFYMIKKGDNLELIADWYNLSIDDIKIWNKLPNNTINTGQVLKLMVSKEDETDLSKINCLSLDEKNKLPELTSFIEALKEFEYYTVISGDALYLIAQKYKGVSADNIMKWNGINTNIQPGQKILIKNK